MRLGFEIPLNVFGKGLHIFHTGNIIINELYAVMEMERVDKGVIVTTSHFTRGAVAEAQRLNGRIRLIDFDELCRLMQQK